MTTYSGTTGTIKVSTDEVAEMDSWDVTSDQDLIETTAFGDTGKTVRAGFRHWSGKASGRFDPTDTAQAAILQALLGTQQTITLTFVVATSPTAINFTGDAWVKQFDVKDSATGLAEVDFTFEGDGALTANYT